MGHMGTKPNIPGFQLKDKDFETSLYLDKWPILILSFLVYSFYFNRYIYCNIILGDKMKVHEVGVFC